MRLWQARLTDKEMLSELHKVFDTTQYGLRRTKFREIRKSLGLIRTREQAHTVESICHVMAELRSMYPQAGAREMISHLFHSHGMQVSRRVVRDYFAIYEPELVKQRKANRLQRRQFWAAGVNDIWAVDQHDKWQRFGLRLHTAVEPFSGRILWLKVWHSNRNPQLILSYYLACAQDFGCTYIHFTQTLNLWRTYCCSLLVIPMITQSDPGTENIGIANAQTLLRQMHDPTLQGFVQHRWMRTKKNIMPEIIWSQFRRRFAPGFEALLEEGVDAGWYDSDNTLQMMVFRWLFIPWMQQQELDSYVQRLNNTRKRSDKKKILPHGILEMIHRCAEDYGALDFKVAISHEALDHVHSVYIDNNHPVFNLVPPSLDCFIAACYDELGRPVVERQSVWSIYCALLDLVRLCEDLPPVFDSVLDTPEDDGELSLIPGLEDLPEVEGYLGGVGNELEHLSALDALDLEDEPDIPLDAEPELWVNAFSMDEEDDMDDVDNAL
ncbi:hypothetical protein JVT61DRAFT_14075 [Boletus reticuloceps]|uniref:Uncharacterized protein n=1 Tax=Boletus reticuloceps TaxID=495285 RepID=A0A8I3ADD9_9AGAM|nr:hypothetical protein JVT61DRAFT_14075 [Boletus reticuloceps]